MEDDYVHETDPNSNTVDCPEGVSEGVSIPGSPAASNLEVNEPIHIWQIDEMQHHQMDNYCMENLSA